MKTRLSLSNMLTLASLLIAALILPGCGGEATMSAEVYERYVIETLKSDPGGGGGLGPLVSLMLSDLECEPNVCTTRIRFQFLNEEIQPRLVIAADMEGRICERKDEVKPPNSHQQQHDTICESLDDVFKTLDRIQLHTASAIRLSAGQTQGVDQLMNGFSDRLAGERQTLLQLQTTLRNINWLRPVL